MTPRKLTAKEMLDREFLQIRCRIIDIAASLDRIDRSGSAAEVRDDPRWEQLFRGIRALLEPDADRATRVQAVFSDPYDEHWRDR